MPADRVRQELLGEAVTQWVRTDRESVLAKADATSDPWLKTELINALINDPAHFREPEDLQKVLGVLGKEGAAAVKTIETQFWNTFTGENPERAAQMLQQGEQLSEHAQSAVAGGLAGQHAASDPAGALEWALQQPGPEVRKSAAEAAIQTWAQSDAYEASAWLAAQPPGPLRDQAAQGFVHAIFHTDPESAAPWAESITDDEVRRQLLKQIVGNMQQRGPARTGRLVDSLQQISPEFRQELRGMIPSGGGQ